MFIAQIAVYVIILKERKNTSHKNRIKMKRNNAKYAPTFFSFFQVNTKFVCPLEFVDQYR